MRVKRAESRFLSEGLSDVADAASLGVCLTDRERPHDDEASICVDDLVVLRRGVEHDTVAATRGRQRRQSRACSRRGHSEATVSAHSNAALTVILPLCPYCLPRDGAPSLCKLERACRAQSGF